MKEFIQPNDYAETITKALGKGILLNTKDEKFNAMVIGWGGLGRTWNRWTFTVLVREHRYTKARIDRTGEFTVSVPLNGPDPEITRVCGSRSGGDIDKVKEAGLTVDTPEATNTPGVREYPLTLECKVLYAQTLDLSALPEDIRAAMYPPDVDGSHPMANRDAHTVYVGEIVSAYIIR